MKSILKSPMYYKTSILIRQKVKRLLCIKREDEQDCTERNPDSRTNLGTY